MALGCIVKPCKAQTVRREPIDIRRFDFTSVASKVSVSEVIDHHEYDVRTRGTVKVKSREEHDSKDGVDSHVGDIVEGVGLVKNSKRIKA
jgi:hypothetical protein